MTMNTIHPYSNTLTRRHFFGRAGVGLAALSSLLSTDLRGENAAGSVSTGGLAGLPHFPPKARRVIYLFQSGGPSQIDLFDHKLVLKDDSRFKGIEKENERVLFVPYQPTCENMLLDIVIRIKDKMPEGVTLHSAFLRETPRSYAEWFASDQ